MEGRSGGGSRKAAWVRAGRLLSDSGVPPSYPMGQRWPQGQRVLGLLEGRIISFIHVSYYVPGIHLGAGDSHDDA